MLELLSETYNYISLNSAPFRLSSDKKFQWTEFMKDETNMNAGLC